MPPSLFHREHALDASPAAKILPALIIGQIAIPGSDGRAFGYRPLLRSLPARTDYPPEVPSPPLGTDTFKMHIRAAARQAWRDRVETKLGHGTSLGMLRIRRGICSGVSKINIVLPTGNNKCFNSLLRPHNRQLFSYRRKPRPKSCEPPARPGLCPIFSRRTTPRLQAALRTC